MKKQYDTTRLTDELKNSVFFQQRQQNEPAAAPPHQRESKQAALTPKHQVTKAPELQSDLAPNDQSTKALHKQGDKTPEQQNTKAAKNQITVALKHFSSYLQPGTYKAWKLLATEREKKDYEILQEAVEQYLAREANEL